ncbi:MAG: ribonuclease [Bacteroidota bacterium]
MKKKKSTKVSPNAQIKVLKGRLDISRSGMGFVIVEELQKDILVKPNDFGKAMHGDIVRVQIAKGGGLNRRVEGKIVDVAERKQTRFTGDIHISRDIAFFEPSGNKPIPDFFIPNDQLNGAGNGDRVIVKLIRWDANDRKPIGRVESVISAKDEADMAMKELLIENGFALEFEELVLQEMNELNERITKEELDRRKDFRDVLTFTIDPIDARDFDDALSIRELENDVFEIGVHIADVSHFVKPQSLLNQEAYQRATSVYLPDRVNPMLPEKISNELCSLRPHEDKFTFSCVFEIERSGKIKKHWIGRTLIHSNHRFTYEDVQTIIETKSGLYSEELLLLNQLAQTYRKDRFDHGAINFSSTEVRFKLDEDGKPIGIIVKESKEAHKLIEEFMLLANRTVAEYVSKIKVNDKPLPFPYRIHDTPDDEKLKPFVAFARKFGYHFDMHDEREVATSFNNLLKEVHGKPEQHVLEQLGIRTMAKAVYTSDNIGHYGLGFEHYCHFTSPIRRYPDVMVHRILQDCLDGNPKWEKNLEAWCKHCSERERAAMETERAGNKYKQVEFMKQYVGEEFDGIISGVSSFGFWVETVDHKCEGLVSLRDINVYDEFFHEESDYALVGAHTKKKFRMGDKIRIQVLSANLTKRQLDYAWVAEGIGAIGTQKIKSKK